MPTLTGKNTAIALALSTAALVGGGFAMANAGGPANKADSRPAGRATTSPAEATPAAPVTTAPEVKTAGTGPKTTRPTSLRKVDWRNTTLTLPALDTAGPACRGGQVTFKAGVGFTKDSRYQVLPERDRAAYGDLDGDRREDALLHVYCGPKDREATDWLVAMKAAPQGKPVPLGAIEPDGGHWFSGYRISGGVVFADSTDIPGDRTVTQRFGWDGKRFYRLGDDDHTPSQHVDATSYDWSRATLTIPFRGATASVQPGDRSCPRKTVTFTAAGKDQGAVQAGGCEYWILKLGNADLNRDGKPDALVRITATPLGLSHPSTGNMWYFAYTIRNGKPAPIAFVTNAGLPNRLEDAPPQIDSGWAAANTGAVTVAQRFTIPGKKQQALVRFFRWNGAGFTPDRTAPNQAADVAP